MRVVLVDDDSEMRALVQSLLEGEADIEVVGFAGNGADALLRIRELEPALVLMDVVMPGMGGIEATRLAIARLPALKVIGFSLHDDRHFVGAMRAAGASGYLLKDCVHEELARALRTVFAGGSWWGAPE